MIYHERNMGKGASVRTGFREATGEYGVIQDADFEYDPNELALFTAKASATKARGGLRLAHDRRAAHL